MPDLGNAYVNIVPKAPGIEGKIGSLFSGAEGIGEKAGGNIGAGLKNGILAVAESVGNAVANIGRTIIDGAMGLAEYGDNIDKMSQKMGLSRQAYQEWDAIMQHSGTTIESMQASMKTLANAVELENDAFSRIGLSMEEVASMSNEDLFAATIRGLQNVESETERTYLAGQLLGRGATELGALLNMSAEDTETMRQRVHELGGVMSDDAVLASAHFQDSLQDMQTAFEGVKRSIAAHFLPGITEVVDGFTALIAGEEGAEKMIANGLSSILTNAEAVANQLFSLARSLLPSISSVITNHLPDIIVLGVQIISNIAVGLLQGLPTLISSLPEIFSAVFDAFGQVDWLEIGTQIVQGIINGIASGASALWSTIQDLASSAWQAAKRALGIASPSKVMADEVGKWIPAGMAEGIADNLAPIDASAQLMANAAMPDVQPAAGGAPVSESNTAELLDRLLTALQELKFDFYMDGRQITDCVTIRQRNALRTGGAA